MRLLACMCLAATASMLAPHAALPQNAMGSGSMLIQEAFHPVRGEGTRYEETDEHGKSFWTVVVVGQEATGGKTGDWIETHFQSGGEKGLVTKELVTPEAGKLVVKRLIVQRPGAEAQEQALAAAGAQPSSGLVGMGLGKKLGRVVLVTPAGKFNCERYQFNAGNANGEAWLSPRATPYGIVKMTAGEMEIEAVELLHGQSSSIPAAVMPKPR